MKKTAKKARLISGVMAVLMLGSVLSGCGQTTVKGPEELADVPVSTTKTVDKPAAEQEAEAPAVQTTPDSDHQETDQSVQQPNKPEAGGEPAVQVSEEPAQQKPEAPAVQTTPEAVPSEMVAESVEVKVEEEELEDEAVALSDSPAALPVNATAVASGTQTKENSDAVIDYSNAKDGYVMVRYTAQTDSRLKAQVKGPATTYTYNLTAQQWAALPLSDGNGSYQIVVYKNVTGTKYAAVLSLTTQVTLGDEFAPFLRSNQYVNFDAAPKTVAKAAELTKGMEDPLKKVEAVYDYVVRGMTYDKELAANVKSGYLPELDKVLDKKSGICFDYAALMTGMLRSQNVPCKLVVGYAGKAYHAWISVWSEKTGWVDGVIWFNGESWQRMDPTFASSGNSSESIMAYIGDGKNYSAKYFY